MNMDIFETSHCNKMSFGNLLFDLQAPARNFVRLIEKNNKKIVNKKYALVFNQTCINEELLPNYTNIYIYIYIYIYLKP
jgi:hypothetical protein